MNNKWVREANVLVNRTRDQNYFTYRIYSIKRRNVYLIFRDSSAAVI